MADKDFTTAGTGHSRQWVEWIASRFADELLPSVFIKHGVKNSDLLGSYAEATVRRLVRRSVSPLQVHRGSILYERHLTHTAPQLDAIVWSPLITPAICQFDDFALVPRGNAFGILEIKRSDYSDAGKGIAKTLDAASDLDVPPECRRGVICVQDNSSLGGTIDQLRKDERVVVLIDNRGDTPRVNHLDICSLINALNSIRTYGIQKLVCLHGHVPIINTELLQSE